MDITDLPRCLLASLPVQGPIRGGISEIGLAQNPLILLHDEVESNRKCCLKVCDIP
jgi:hypothetical protein